MGACADSRAAHFADLLPLANPLTGLHSKLREMGVERAAARTGLEALRKSASKARSEMAQQEGSRSSVSSENVYG